MPQRLHAALPMAAVTILVLLPLAGLAYALIEPPAAPFGTPPVFAEVIASDRVWSLFARSLALGGVVAAASLALGTLLAWFEQRCHYPGRRVLGIAALLPLAMPSYLVAAVMRHEFSAGGWFGFLGIASFAGWLASAIVLTIICSPLVQLVVGAALARTSAAEEEAARSLGASPVRILRAVWLPRLRPAWAVGLILVALYVISDFGAVVTLDCQVLTYRLYQAWETSRYMEMAVLGLVVLLATVPLVVGAACLRGRRSGAAGVANPRPAPRRRLRAAWQLAAWLLHLPVIVCGVVLPIVTCARWTLSGELAGDFLAAVFDSLYLTGIGTLVVVVLALAAAWPAARRRSRAYRSTLEQGVFLTGALPGVLLAAGLLLAALGLAHSALEPSLTRSLHAAGITSHDLYGWLKLSGILLFPAFAVRFLPEAFAPLKAAVLHIDQRQIDSARTLGVGRLRRWLRLLIPALAPGCAVAAVLVAIAILKELPITLMLGGTRRPLSYRMWERYDSAFLPDAGLAGLLLAGLALVAVVVSLRFRRHV